MTLFITIILENVSATLVMIAAAAAHATLTIAVINKEILKKIKTCGKLTALIKALLKKSTEEL